MHRLDQHTRYFLIVISSDQAPIPSSHKHYHEKSLSGSYCLNGATLLCDKRLFNVILYLFALSLAKVKIAKIYCSLKGYQILC